MNVVSMVGHPYNVPIYRGFQIGYVIGLHGVKAAWRSSLEPTWIIGNIYVDSIEEVEDLAKECIDFNYHIDVREAVLGRKLTMDELLEEKP